MTNLLMYLQPLAGVFFSWLLLGEHLGLSFFAGGLLVLFGVGLVSFQNGEKEMVDFNKANANVIDPEKSTIPS